MECTLHLSDVANETVRQAILGPMMEYNESRAGASGYRPLVVELHASDGSTNGGLWGGTGYGWLFTQLLVVPEPLRGRGLGRRLMALAEEEALRRDCHSAWLDTFEFQAKSFYERLGYTCFGELNRYPQGFSRYFMQKSLVEAK